MKIQNGLIATAVAAALSTPVYAADSAVTVSGLVEVAATSLKDNIGVSTDPTLPETTTDLVVATASVAVDAKLSEQVSAHLSFLYEEDDQVMDGATFGLDEATVSLQLSAMTTLTAGRTAVPFGSFETNMISDPLTLALGETSETAFMLAFAEREVTASFYTFRGDADVVSATPPATIPDDDALSYGANISYATDPLTVGVSYISNITESDSLQNPGGLLAAEVPGAGVNLAVNMNNASFIAEYVAASDAFTNGDQLAAGTVANKETPTATNVEFAFESGGATLAVAYQTTSEAQFLGLPETVTSGAVSFDLVPGASMGIEYASIDDYSVTDGGTGETNTAITILLGVEF